MRAEWLSSADRRLLLRGTGSRDHPRSTKQRGGRRLGPGDFGWLATLYIPESLEFVAEHRSEFLEGVTVLKGELRQLK